MNIGETKCALDTISEKALNVCASFPLNMRICASQIRRREC